MKEIIFDMDGTIADFYNYPQWLKHLESRSVKPYLECQPLYDMDVLNTIIRALQNNEYNIKIVSWACKNASDKYIDKIAKAKKQWLKRFSVPYNECYVIPYGVDKANYATKQDSILVDDNEGVREVFENSGKTRKAIDATKNIIVALSELLMGIN